MRILLLGGSGLLGSEVRLLLPDADAPSHLDLDITDPVAVVEAITSGGYDWCINCAAYTGVDSAETDRDSAFALNTLAPGYLARSCLSSNTRLIHISTDFVFDGALERPCTEEDRTNPLGAYGESKLEGEVAVLAANPTAVILRTAWLFGPRGKCFPRTIIRAALEGKTLRVVADQVGSPTYAPDLAKVIVRCYECDIAGGVYHAAGPAAMSWFEFAVLAVTAGAASSKPIEPIRTQDWPTPAKRPAYSVLACPKLDALGITPMRPLTEAMADFFAESRAQDS